MKSSFMTFTISVCMVLAVHSQAVATQIQVYGTWHCGNDGCKWNTVRNMADFDTQNHWIIDRGDGVPSVNLVVLAFVNPLKLLNRSGKQTGAPIGMNSKVIQYFTRHKIRVMLSIGGISFVNDWDTALATNATQLGLYAAALARQLNVGIEIDYEQKTNPNLKGLEAFIKAYRSQVPYDASGADPAARLTIDLGSGDRFLPDLARTATTKWLNPAHPVLDYANAMVPSPPPANASAAEANWNEHVAGRTNLAVPIPPLAPAKFTGSVFLTNAPTATPECTNFDSSLEKSTSSFVQTVAPAGAGTSAGMLGYMFWAAECPSSKNICTTPPNGCERGVGVGAQMLHVPLPMPALRQQ